MFDWVAFLDQHGIEYITAGRNVGRGNAAIKCPFCGDDPSEHLNIRLNRDDAGSYTCYRNRTHRGRNADLVQTLLNCSWDEAKRLTSSEQSMPADYNTALLERLTVKVPAPHVFPLELLPAFKPLWDKPSARAYRNYLVTRGYPRSMHMKLTQRYGIRYCALGPFFGRVIFPVRYKGKLITWTGRTIYAKDKVLNKYKALSPHVATEELPAPLPVARGLITDYLLWYDRLARMEAHTLIMCEGPFDALKVNVLGKEHGIGATCFFTSAPSDRQIEHVYALVPKFKRKVLLLDHDTITAGMQTMDRMRGLGVDYIQLPANFKDPGDITSTRDLLQILS